MKLSNLERLVENFVAPNNWLTIKEASAYTRCSDTTLRRAISRGVLKCSRRTGKLLFKRFELDRWLENG